MFYTILMFIVTSLPPDRYASRSDDFVMGAFVSDAFVSDAFVSNAFVGTLFKASAIDNVFPAADNVLSSTVFVIFQGANVDDNGNG